MLMEEKFRHMLCIIHGLSLCFCTGRVNHQYPIKPPISISLRNYEEDIHSDAPNRLLCELEESLRSEVRCCVDSFLTYCLQLVNLQCSVNS